MRRAGAVALALLGLLAAAVPLADQVWRQADDVVSGPARVVDGDTLVIAGERVRLKRIDAAEMNVEAGRQAKAGMEALIGGGIVTCTGAVRDAYARRLADCSVQGRDLGAAMIEAGLARRR